MASPSSHLKQWKHNRDFIPLVPPTHADWLVTVTFYTALHAVDALLNSDNVPRLTSHDARNSVLMKTTVYQKIWKHYSPLYSLSRAVRYLAEPDLWIDYFKAEEQILRRCLYPIEKSVKGLLLGRRVIIEEEMTTTTIVLSK